MTRRLLFALALCLSTLRSAGLMAQGASDRDAVKRAALDYLEGFYEGDTAKLVRSVQTDVYKYGFDWVGAEKRYAGEQMTWDEILGYARRFKAKGRTTPATAPRSVDLFEVQDQTASAKVTAWWGTDYLLLAKYDGTWKITHVLWQSERK